VVSATPDFDEWVAARGPSLLRLAYVLTGSRDDAEDMVEEALSRALPCWSRISNLQDPEAHLRRMVISAHVPRRRRFRRRATPISTLVDLGAATGIAIEVRDVVWHACRLLPADQRTAVVLRLYEDLEVEEIAALTGVREGTVRSRVAGGMAVLRAAQGEEITDVDQLRDSLVFAAEQAPTPTDVARGARAKLRRRRARSARTAAVAAAAIAVTALIPVGIVLSDGDGGADRSAPVLPPLPNVVTERPTTNDVTQRDELTKTIFWLGITLEVPARWQRGSTLSWCSKNDDPAAVKPRVAFPGDIAEGRRECAPRSGYGVIMGSAATFEPTFDSRRVQQYDASAHAVPSYPDDAWLYAWYDDEAVITVVTPDPGLTHQIATSIAREELDANGCAAVYDELALPTAVGSRGVGASLCRYGTAGRLEDSQRLTERETARAVNAIAAAPIQPGGDECALEEGWRVTLTPAGQAAYLALYGTQGSDSCRDGLRSTAPGQDPDGYVELTPEILAALDLDDLPEE
jgi:RNA polymerase sigma factor (sigma-70 family)